MVLMPMIEVFKTNVETQEEAAAILNHFSLVFPQHKMNFDLDDCDRILRVETEEGLDAEEIIRLLKERGFVGGVLE